MIILSTAATRDGRGDLELGLFLCFVFFLKRKIKKCEKGTEGKRASPWPGGESFKWNWKHMKSVFLLPQNAHLPATSYNRTIRVRQGEREREGGSEATWKDPETTSLILALQFSIVKIVSAWKFALLLRPVVSYCLRHFVLIENQILVFLLRRSSSQLKSCFQPVYTRVQKIHIQLL